MRAGFSDRENAVHNQGRGADRRADRWPRIRAAAGVWAAVAAGFFGGAAAAAEQILSRQHCVTVWTTDDGLPDNAVMTVARTADGYLWVGTSDCGVARFNGVEFQPIGGKEAHDLPPPRVHRLIRADDGTLWVSFLTGDVGAVRGRTIASDRTGGGDTLSWWLQESLGEHDGNRWFSTNLGDVVRRSGSGDACRWTLMRAPGEGIATLERTVVTGGDRTILGTAGSGAVWRLEGEECRPLPASAYARSSGVDCLATDRAGNVWAGTHRGLAVWDGAAFVPVPEESDPDPDDPQHAIAVMPVSDGGLWVLFAGSLKKYRAGRWEITAGPWDDRLLAAVSPRRHRLYADDRTGGVWVATDGEGLWHVSAGGRIVEVTSDPAFPQAQVECLEVDAEGSLWLGLERRGLARVRPRLFTPPAEQAVGDAAGLAATGHSMCVDTAGAVWLTESGGGLWKTAAGGIERVAGPVGSPAYNSVVAPAAGEGIWLAPQFASVSRQEHGQRRDVLPTSAFGGVARAMHEDRAGRLWIGNEYGLWCWQAGKLFSVGAAAGFSPLDKGSDAESLVPGVDSLADDGAGGMWIGLSRCELRHLDAEGGFTRHRPSWWSPGIRFWSLLSDGEGGVWIGTLGSGLLHFSAGTFRRVTAADGLPDNAVSQVLDDGRGAIWLGTFSGVVRVSQAEIADLFAGRSAGVQCRRFGRAAGLPVAQCSAGQQPYSVRARDGRLWFSTTGGVVVVDPEAIGGDALPPPVVVEEARVLGRDVLAERPLPLALGPRERTVQFRFAGLSLATPELIRYRWRMAGIDQDWIDGGFERTATYNQLPPGRYVFEVDAADGDGRWTGTAVRVPIVIEPMVWETGWFRGLAALAAVAVTVGIALAVIRRRTQRRIDLLERQSAIERERIRIARDLHDDLGASLTEIDLLGALAERGGPTTPEVADRLRSLRGKARETVMSLDEIVWAVDPRNDTLGSLGEYVGSFAQQFFRATTTRCRLAIDPEPRDLPLDSEVRHALFLAFKEAVNNVARHAGAEECRVSLAVTGGELRIEVSDDGCGFGANAAGFVPGEGLRNIRERLAACGGWQRLDSAPGKGTTIALGLLVASRGGRRPFASAVAADTIRGSA